MRHTSQHAALLHPAHASPEARQRAAIHAWGQGPYHTRTLVGIRQRTTDHVALSLQQLGWRRQGPGMASPNPPSKSRHPQNHAGGDFRGLWSRPITSESSAHALRAHCAASIVNMEEPGDAWGSKAEHTFLRFSEIHSVDIVAVAANLTQEYPRADIATTKKTEPNG
eukprot:gene24218-biopygen22375